MSHFLKAIERARSASKDLGLNLPDEAPSADLFDSPWGIDERPEPTAITPRVAPASTPAPILRIHPDVFDRVVINRNVSPLAVEQYRMLAASLHRWQGVTGGKVVLVAGTASGDGATLTTVNLAITLAGAYRRRVLLVDGDQRENGLHKALMASRGTHRERSSGAPPPPVAVGPRLNVVAAKPSTGDAAPTLTPSTIALLERSREGFDWVLLDVDAGIDARLLSEHVDGIVLVLAAGKTGRDTSNHAVSTLGRGRILGVVLNGVDPGDVPDGASV
jgi:Mrp family chromosome partitioning ATPase